MATTPVSNPTTATGEDFCKALNAAAENFRNALASTRSLFRTQEGEVLVIRVFGDSSAAAQVLRQAANEGRILDHVALCRQDTPDATDYIILRPLFGAQAPGSEVQEGCRPALC